MAVSKKAKKQVVQAVIKGIQRNGDRVFDISQQEGYVPVDTGFLKASGYVERKKNGVKIGYRADYASAIEFGIPNDVPIKGDQVVHRRTYVRRGYTRKDGAYVPPAVVPARDVVYHNQRLIPLRESAEKGRGKLIFRVISKIKARAGRFYLHRALQEGIKFLPEDIKYYLKDLGKVR